MVLNERYEVQDRLGSGGMALVYRALDRRLGRPVALKMLRPQYASNNDFVRRFDQEAMAAAALNHPHIAQVHDTGQEGDTHYIVMELLRPVTLKDKLRETPGGRLPADRVIQYGTEIARALRCAHEHGVVHRDIKPQNILFTDDDHVKVADFGIARALSATESTATGTILGSPHYLSPEQASGEPAQPASDLYSLGVVLYELVTGRTPFSGETPVAIAVQHLRGTAPPIRSLAPDCPEPLAQLIARLMAREPSARFASAAEVVGALERIRDGGPLLDDATRVMPALSRPVPVELPPTTTSPRVVPGARPGSARPGLSPGAAAGLSALTVAALAIGVFLALQTPREPTDEVPGDDTEVVTKTLQVPDLIGQDVTAARLRLETYYRGLGLTAPQLVEAGYEENAAPRDQILRQRPLPGVEIVEGDVIEVWVSTGVTLADMPDLSGLTERQARSALENAELNLGRVSEEHHDRVPAGQVIGQGASAGTRLPMGTAVDVTISKGPAPAEETPPVEPEPEVPHVPVPPQPDPPVVSPDNKPEPPPPGGEPEPQPAPAP